MILQVLYLILGFLIVLFMLIIIVFMPIAVIPKVISHKGFKKAILRILVIPGVLAVMTYIFIWYFFGDNINSGNYLKYYGFVPAVFFFTLFIFNEKYF